MLEDYAFIPLWSELQVTVTMKNITGFEPSVHGDYLILTKMEKRRPGRALTTAPQPHAQGPARPDTTPGP